MLTETIKKLFAALECSDAHASILFTDDREMRSLNKQYRGKDKATDVLSFAALDVELPKALRKHAPRMLGDLVISVDTLLRQAKEYGVTPKEELLRLLIHGTLHLLGYDHENVSAREAQRMRRKEAAVLRLMLSGS